MQTDMQVYKHAIQQIRKCQAWLEKAGGMTKELELLDAACDRLEKLIIKEGS